MSSGAIEAVDRILNRGEPDALAQVVAALHERGFAWIAVLRRDGSVAAAAGERPPVTLQTPIVHRGRRVGEIEVAADEADRPLLERVALLVSALV